MFDIIKQKVNLLEYITKDLDLNLKDAGTDTYAIEDEKDYGGCPMCGHMDCFKIKYEESAPQDAMYKCFSCDAHGSVIDWVAMRNKLTPLEAARKLVKDFNIPLPNDFSPLQEIFNAAATYYSTCLWETCNKPSRRLSNMTPLEYQLRVRKHSEEALRHFNVGWSDGGLVAFLESLGYEEDLLLESGLVSKKTSKDFLPNDCFIYPHFAKGRVSHFTFKDPLKKLAYQLPNKFVLNGCEFYNQDSIKDSDTVLIVEGENDVISAWEKAKTGEIAVIGTIGSISGAQLEWIRTTLYGKSTVVTAFDPDDAGNKYREKLEKIRPSLKGLVQTLPPEGKDIDAHLSSGAVLSELLNNNVVQVVLPKSAITITTPAMKIAAPDGSVTIEGSTGNPEAVDELTESTIQEKNGCYYKIKFKDGEPTYVKLTNCTIKVYNVFVTEEGERKREITVTKDNGFTSDPVYVDDDTKVSVKPFRVMLARAADADFRGSENDLADIWCHEFSKSAETTVRIARTAGRHEKTKGWIFHNKYIADTGVVIDADDDGVFWLNGKASGIKPGVIDEGVDDEGGECGALRINTESTLAETEALLQGLINNLAKNLGGDTDPEAFGKTLLLLGYMNACAYSNTIFKLNVGFPLLFLWASHGEGKGTICSWILSTYNMASSRIAINKIKSGVGLSRMANYYSSLPIWIDEVRADRETAEFQGMFRDFYDRGGRTMGTKSSHGVRTMNVKSCFLFAGEDNFPDQAMRERLITVRVDKGNREKVESFRWLEDNKHLMSAIGYNWILESVNEDHANVRQDIIQLDRDLREVAGCSARKSKLWAAVGMFSIRLAEKFCPTFDMKKYLYETSKNDAIVQKSESTVLQFFEVIESITSMEGFKRTINEAHMCKDGDLFYIWYAHAYRMVQEEHNGRFAFSRNAVLASLREEPYFVSDNTRKVLGVIPNSGERRPVIILDLTKTPEVIRNIARVNEG